MSNFMEEALYEAKLELLRNRATKKAEQAVQRRAEGITGNQGTKA